MVDLRKYNYHNNLSLVVKPLITQAYDSQQGTQYASLVKEETLRVVILFLSREVTIDNL